MARTVVAIYDDFQSANSAVRDLVDSGFPRDNISLIANNSRGEYGYTGTDTASNVGTSSESVADETGAGAGVGAGIGAAIGGIGGLLVGLGALTIPGIGPIIAAGPLAVALSTLTGAGVGAVAGGVTGGLLGALIGLGIPEEEAGYYAEGVRRGGVLLTIQAEDQNTDQVMDILNRHNPIDINSRVEQWRSQGWSGYDPNAQAYDRSADVTSERQDFDRERRDFDRSTDTSLERPDYDRSTTGMTGEMRDRDYDRSMTGMTGGMGQMDTETYRAEFDPEYSVYRTHYTTYLENSGYPYDYYVPAYRYGYGLANNPNYRGRSWEMIEMDARRDWERDQPGTWERVKDAIRNAWDDVTGRR